MPCSDLPALLETTLKLNAEVEKIARKYMNARDFLYLGRGINYPIALEGALKLKEISYIHAEGYPAGEMKHGPIALIDENMPVVVLAPRNGTYEKVVSNMEEVIARGGRVIAICSDRGRRDPEKGRGRPRNPAATATIWPRSCCPSRCSCSPTTWRC